MATIQKLFLRIASITAMILLTLVTAVPTQSTAAAGPVPAASIFQNDDFNHCSLNQGTPLWTFENPAGFPNPVVTGAFTGASTLTLTVPPGKEASMSSRNKDAPRIMQKVSGDTDFSVEVAFDSPLGKPPAGAWNIQGILFRDSSVAGQSKWVRIELNTNSAGLNYYIGAIDAGGTLHSISGPSALSLDPAIFTRAPLYLDITYKKGATAAADSFSLSYRLGNNEGWHLYKKTFTKGDMAAYIPSFTITDVGVFAGSTSDTSGLQPGIVSQVDYMFDPVPVPKVIEDTVILKTAVNGNGTISQTCLPNTNQVSLQAKASTGGTFIGWTGLDAPSAQNPVTLTMTKSYNVTANFTGGTAPPPLLLQNPIFIPFVSH